MNDYKKIKAELERLSKKHGIEITLQATFQTGSATFYRGDNKMDVTFYFGESHRFIKRFGNLSIQQDLISLFGDAVLEYLSHEEELLVKRIEEARALLAKEDAIKTEE